METNPPVHVELKLRSTDGEPVEIAFIVNANRVDVGVSTGVAAEMSRAEARQLGESLLRALDATERS